MARNSTYGESHGSEISKYARAIIGNAGIFPKKKWKF